MRRGLSWAVRPELLLLAVLALREAAKRRPSTGSDSSMLALLRTGGHRQQHMRSRDGVGAGAKIEPTSG
jgi:hypothetical protein